MRSTSWFARNAAGKPTVLGLATGSTPVGLYRELIRLHKDEGLDLSRVVTFNLDEYYPMPRESQHSYFRWMHETLFNHVNIKWENIHIPDGTSQAGRGGRGVRRVRREDQGAGGIDIQILGIGRTGHIGFNEPGSPQNSRTRLVTLDSITRRDAADGFFGEENVPHQAITMGVASILDARRIFLMAFGEHKAGIVYKARRAAADRGDLRELPARTHRTRLVLLDEAAAAELTAIKRPWEVGPCAVDAGPGPQGRRCARADREEGACRSSTTTTSATTTCTNCSARRGRPSASAKRCSTTAWRRSRRIPGRPVRRARSASDGVKRHIAAVAARAELADADRRRSSSSPRTRTTT